jgi:N-acetylglutamate synthase-like GNAT family acetyltransferase
VSVSVKFRAVGPEDYAPIRDFLRALGWEERVRDSARFAAMMENASRKVVAVDGERVVGFARALCDEASNGYISTVAVAADRRREGIGRGLVERLTAGDPERRITWVLRAGRGSEVFWERLGFGRSELAMELVRGSGSAAGPSTGPPN